MTPRLSNRRHAGRPLDFLGFDGKTYNGRIVRIARRHFLVFTYYVFGTGEVSAVLDLRTQRDRIAAIY